MPAENLHTYPIRWLSAVGDAIIATGRMLGSCAMLAILFSFLATTLVEAKSYTRDGAIRAAVAGNLELRVAAVEIDRAKSRRRWSGRLANPEIELSHSNDLIGQNENEGNIELAFSQRFPVTSRLSDEREVRRRDVELAEIEFRIRQRQLAYEVDRAWITLRAALRAELASAELIRVNGAIAKFISDGAAVGEASPLDAVQASLNGKLLEQELAMAKAAVAEASSRLKQLMGVPAKNSVGIASSSSFPKEAPASAFKMEKVLRNRPDYELLLASKNLGDAQLDLAMSQRWDDLAVRVFVQRERAVDEPEGLERSTFTGVGVSIPLPLRNKNEQAIEEAEIDIEKARKGRAAKMFAIHSELTRVMGSRLAAHKMAKLALSGAVPLAKKNLTEFETAQKNGQVSYLQVQQAQTQLLQLENSALELQMNYDLLDAEVRFISGTYPIPTKTSK